MSDEACQGRLFASHLCRAQIKLVHGNLWIDVLVELGEPLPELINERFAIEDTLLQVLVDRGYDIAMGPILIQTSEAWIERHRASVPLIEGDRLAAERTAT